MITILINLLIVSTIIFRLLANKITLKLIDSGEYEEANPISRKFLKYPKLKNSYDILNFFFALISYNTIIFFYSNLIIMIFFAFLPPCGTGS